MHAFSNLCTIQLCHNDYLDGKCRSIAISIHNLSTTFALIKYRAYIGDGFNEQMKNILTNTYSGYTTVARRLDAPWYAVSKFGRAHYNGNQARQKDIYEKISILKWNIIKELQKTFSIHFLKERIFPPSFATLSTNIPFIEDGANKEFWSNALPFGVNDFSKKHNAFLHWNNKLSKFEGTSLSIFCGVKQSKDDSLSEIFLHNISDRFATYLVADSLLFVSKRDIAKYNERISKSILRTSTSNILRVRVMVEKKLYYSYRFLNEFSGNTIDEGDVVEFENLNYKNSSISSRCFEGIKKRITESKSQIDNILKLLNDAAEYRSSKSNISLQWIMMIITVLSLIIAVLSMNNSTFFEWMESLLNGLML